MLARLLSIFRRSPRGLRPESKVIVSFDDTTITLQRPNGDTEKVTWRDLEKVEIMTTDEGPLVCDWYWILHGRVGGVAVPQGATGEAELLIRLQALPRFNNQAVIDAAPISQDSRFICWERLPEVIC